MRRRRLLAACAMGLAGFAGCLSKVTTGDGQQLPDDDHQSLGESAPGTDSETPASPETETRRGRPDVSVEYEIWAGNIPDSLQSLGVNVQVVFVNERDELTACLRDTYTGPYKPTITPIPAPSSDACHLSREVAFDLAELEDGTSLGPVTAPGTYTAGHALLVTDVTATIADGETAAVKGTGGHRATVVEGPPDGPYHVELGVDAAPKEASYDYALVSSLGEPAN